MGLEERRALEATVLQRLRDSDDEVGRRGHGIGLRLHEAALEDGLAPERAQLVETAQDLTSGLEHRRQILALDRDE